MRGWEIRVRESDGGAKGLTEGKGDDRRTYGRDRGNDGGDVVSC